MYSIWFSMNMFHVPNTAFHRKTSFPLKQRAFHNCHTNVTWQKQICHILLFLIIYQKGLYELQLASIAKNNVGWECLM